MEITSWYLAYLSILARLNALLPGVDKVNAKRRVFTKSRDIAQVTDGIGADTDIDCGTQGGTVSEEDTIQGGLK